MLSEAQVEFLTDFGNVTMTKAQERGLVRIGDATLMQPVKLLRRDPNGMVVTDEDGEPVYTVKKIERHIPVCISSELAASASDPIAGMFATVVMQAIVRAAKKAHGEMPNISDDQVIDLEHVFKYFGVDNLQGLVEVLTGTHKKPRASTAAALAMCGMDAKLSIEEFRALQELPKALEVLWKRVHVAVDVKAARKTFKFIAESLEAGKLKGSKPSMRLFDLVLSHMKEVVSRLAALHADVNDRIARGEMLSADALAKHKQRGESLEPLARLVCATEKLRVQLQRFHEKHNQSSADDVGTLTDELMEAFV